MKLRLGTRDRAGMFLPWGVSMSKLKVSTISSQLLYKGLMNVTPCNLINVSEIYLIPEFIEDPDFLSKGLQKNKVKNIKSYLTYKN